MIGGNDMAEAKVREIMNANLLSGLSRQLTEQTSAGSREEKLRWESRSYRSQTCKMRSSLCPLPTSRPMQPSLGRRKRGIYSATQWMTCRTATAMHPQ